EVRGRDVADRVPRILVDDQTLRAAERLHQTLGVLERRKLVELTGEAQVGRTDFLGVPLPRHALAELVEAGLVGDAGHVHETHLEGRRRSLEDRVKAGLVTYGRHRDRADAWLVSGRDRPEERAEAVPGHADPVRIDLRAGREPLDRRPPGGHPRGHAEIDTE